MIDVHEMMRYELSWNDEGGDFPREVSEAWNDLCGACTTRFP